MEKFNANFVQVFDKGLLGKITRGNYSFGLTGISVIKKPKNDFDESTTSESKQTTAQNSWKMLQVICEKSNDDLQKSSEEAIMAVNNEVVVHESITIDE